MHDSAPKAPPIGKPGGKSITEKPGGGEAKGHVELHAGPHENFPNAKFHTIHHGHAESGGGGGGMAMGAKPEGEVKGHDSLHAAHHAMNEHMGEDGCSDGSCAEHGGSTPSGAAVEGGGEAGDEY
jgi:hypothetical protein